VNDQTVAVKPVNGYLTIARAWKKGDVIFIFSGLPQAIPEKNSFCHRRKLFFSPPDYYLVDHII
jgi:DUF1680 family protein